MALSFSQWISDLMNTIIYSGTSAYEFNCFYASSDQPNWMRTESNSMVKINTDLMEKFDSILVQSELQPDHGKN